MNAHGCLDLQHFYTCSAGDFKGCCSVNPCDAGVCPDGKASSNQDKNTCSSSESERSSTSTATAGKMNGPSMGKTVTAVPTNTDTGKGGGGATTTDAGTATTTTAGTVWSIPGGILRPSPSPALLGTPSRPDTVTTTTGNDGTSTGTGTSTNPSISINFSSNPMTSLLSPTEQLESATSNPDANPNTSSSDGNNRVLIGSVVGGTLALGVVLAVIFVSFCRHKKMKKKRRRFTLLAWHGPRHNVDREKGVTVAAAGVGSGQSLQAGPTNYNQPTPILTTLPSTIPNYNTNTHTPTSTTHLLRTPILPSPASTFTPPFLERRHRHPLSPIPSNPSLHSTLSSKQDMALGIEQDLGVHPALRGESTKRMTQTGPERVPGTRTGTDPETTPELGDTGIYRQRAELAAYSQSELINIPHERRCPTSFPTFTSSSSPFSSNDVPHKPRGTKIITPDGVLLSANFERFSGCEDYATSFAQCFDGLEV